MMKHTHPTSTMATPRDDARTPQPSRATFGEMLEELIDLTAGLGVALLPVLLLAVPGIILFVVLPAILLLALAAPLAVVGAVIAAPPYLLARWLRRRRRRTASPLADAADGALRPARPAVSRGSGISPHRTPGTRLNTPRRAASESWARSSEVLVSPAHDHSASTTPRSTSARSTAGLPPSQSAAPYAQKSRRANDRQPVARAT
jgi:hypothetical protein